MLDCPAQSSDLIPKENLWADDKKDVGDAKPKNNTELWDVIHRGCHAKPLKRCHSLVDFMGRRCSAEIKNKGHATKY